ncbi:unnamed protein product [Bursaphelenchus okinawaensis]|uniref:Uncharacterized protein n=1 Tax=Bursaphelenchus okinawaensis TaxID=465554 RepID=A0A811L8C5_9BILA|nr:unnamed protein product [Bursaphelenchus okinawaensis]CAG9121019.1 unnamed protein product [Bursaphelenchus okinawaensis]
MGKRKFSQEDEESDAESHINGIEDEEEEAPAGPPPKNTVAPSVMRAFCELIEGLEENKTVESSTKAIRLPKLEAIYKNPKIETFLRKNKLEYLTLCDAYYQYMGKALAKARVELNLANTAVKNYCTIGDAIKLHPKFPEAPANFIKKYLTKTNKQLKDLEKGEMEEYKKQKGGVTSEEKKEFAIFNDELERFLEEERGDMTEDQIKSLKRFIKNNEKKFKPPQERTPKKKKGAIAKKSAFDFYKMAQKQKYVDLDPAKRDMKLRKKFDKLDEDQKEIYISLEQNQED